MPLTVNDLDARAQVPRGKTEIRYAIFEGSDIELDGRCGGLRKRCPPCQILNSLFRWLSDLQARDKKVTLNHLAMVNLPFIEGEYFFRPRIAVRNPSPSSGKIEVMTDPTASYTAPKKGG